jgi:protein tyrosine/serine phosphatase
MPFSWPAVKEILDTLKPPLKRRDFKSDEAFVNFREIKTPGIAPGLLYRGSHPAQAGARGPLVVELCKKTGIKSIINMADSFFEISQRGLALPPWYHDFLLEKKLTCLGMSWPFFTGEWCAKLRRGIGFILENEGPFYIHCYEGFDRTGFFAALLEAFAGASVEEIVEEYMLSYEWVYHVKKNGEQYTILSGLITDNLKSMNNGIDADNSNVRNAAEKFLAVQAGMPYNEIKKLKKKLNGG